MKKFLLLIALSIVTSTIYAQHKNHQKYIQKQMNITTDDNIPFILIPQHQNWQKKLYKYNTQHRKYQYIYNQKYLWHYYNNNQRMKKINENLQYNNTIRFIPYELRYFNFSNENN